MAHRQFLKALDDLIEFYSQILTIILVLKSFPLAVLKVYHHFFQSRLSLEKCVGTLLNVLYKTGYFVLAQIISERNHDKVLTSVDILPLTGYTWQWFVING